MRVESLHCIFLVCIACVVAQQADLENLYKSTNGPQWMNNANWLVSDPCTNQWFGITCVNGSIVAIDLPDNNLDGTLVGLNLPNLTRLDLAYNVNLTGEIPQYINTNISEISLNNTQVHGEFPSWFAQLPYLNTISLSSTNLSGDFPIEWCNLTQLQVLALGEQELTGTLPDCIGNLTSLQYLSIYTTPLRGSIPNSITNLVNLQVLELNYNLLSGSIPENIGQMTSLVHLTMYDNQLEGPLPDDIGSLLHLEELRVRNNKMTGTIPASLQHLQQLNTLGLASNYFTGTIPAFLSSQEMPKLLSIDLRCNNFVGPLPAWLKNDPAMNSDVQVWFGCNNITQSLPKWCLSQSKCGENACDGSRCYVNPVNPNGPNKAVIIPLAIFLGLLLFGNVVLIVFLVKKKCLNRRSTAELKPILGLTPRYSNY